jgi:hypothetical protein
VLVAEDEEVVEVRGERAVIAVRQEGEVGDGPHRRVEEVDRAVDADERALDRPVGEDVALEVRAHHPAGREPEGGEDRARGGRGRRRARIGLDGGGRGGDGLVPEGRRGRRRGAP